jgi:hypothetical protein
MKLLSMGHFNKTKADASFWDNHSYGLSLFLHTTDMDL